MIELEPNPEHAKSRRIFKWVLIIFNLALLIWLINTMMGFMAGTADGSAPDAITKDLVIFGIVFVINILLVLKFALISAKK